MTDEPIDPKRTLDSVLPSESPKTTPNESAAGPASGGQTVDLKRDQSSEAGATIDSPVASPVHANEKRAGADDDQGFVVESGGVTGIFTDPGELNQTQGFDTARSARKQRKLGNVKVPGYEILSELGHGGMGVVYKARDTRLDRTVALKMVLSGIHASESQLARFVQEAKAVAQFQHANIVQIYEINEAEGVPYFSLEFVDGGSLDEKIDHKPQSPQFAAGMLETIARAMQYAHDRNIVHRDLKPGNVLLTRNGSPKIADFGLAKKLDDSSRTQAGDIMGTPNYMAPEQARGDIASIGPLSDQFALGAMLYELLTGRQPFNGASIMKTIEQVLSQDPVPPSQLVPGTPRDIETICMKCLQKDPAKRYANCSELAEDLRRFQSGEPIKARPVSNCERITRWCKRNPVVAGLGGAAVVLLIAITVVSSSFAVTVNGKNQELKQKNEDLDKAANTEHSLRTLADDRFEKSRNLFETLVNDIPLRLEGAIYSDNVRQDIIKQLADLKSKAEETQQVDDRHLAARAEQGELQHQGLLMLQQRKYDKAIEDFDKAVQIAQFVVQDEPKEKDKSAGNLAAALANLGDAYLMKKDFERGREYYERSLKLRRQLVQSPQTSELKPAERRVSLGASLVQLADTLINLGLPKESLPYAAESVAVFDGLPAADMTPVVRQSKAMAHRGLGRAKFLTGDIPGGRKEIDLAVAELQALIKDQPLNLAFSQYLAFVDKNAGDLELINAAAPAEARKRYEEYVAIESALASPRELLRVQRDLSYAHYSLATAALRAGDQETADKEYAKCLAVRRSLVHLSPNDGSLKYDLAIALARCGNVAEAEKIANQFESDAGGKYKNQPPARRLLLRRVGFILSLCAYAIGHGREGTLPPDLQKARQSYVDRALTALEDAAANGYRDVEELSTDPDFDPIRSEPRFSALVAKLRKS